MPAPGDEVYTDESFFAGNEAIVRGVNTRVEAPDDSLGFVNGGHNVLQSLPLL